MISLCKSKHILDTSHIISIWEHIRNITDISELCDIQVASKGTTLNKAYGIRRELLKYIYVYINIGNKKYENYSSVDVEI